MRVTIRVAALLSICVFGSAASQAADILFLTGAATPSAADQAIMDRLTNVLGYSVTQMDGHVALRADMGDGHLLMTSATLGSSVIKNQWNSSGPVTTGGNGGGFRNLPYPIINFQNGISDELGFNVSTNGGQGSGTNTGSAYPSAGNDINILDATSPLAAGLSAGWHSIFTTTPSGVSVFGNTAFGPFGNQVAPAVRITAGTSTLATGNPAIDTAFVAIVSLEQGDALGNLTPSGVGPGVYAANAPTRRVEFPIDATSFLNLNADGLKLFDAAVAYAYAGAVPEPGTFALAGTAVVGMIGYGLRAKRRSRQA